MCGIVGYIGRQNAVPILMDGLSRLAYRGYDSAGIAFTDNEGQQIVKSVGKLENLSKVIEGKGHYSQCGIGHTRWATHGKPTKINAHPHRSGDIVLVHNGIIENFLELKQNLKKKGRIFLSDTDTEIISNLIDDYKQSGLSLFDSVLASLKDITGAYALCIFSVDNPNQIICVKNGCPIILGLGDGEYFIGSDIPAFLHHTREVAYMKDGEIAVVDQSEGVNFFDFKGQKFEKTTEKIEWTATLAEKDGYKHFMAKEIHEQAVAITKTVKNRIGTKPGEILLPEFDNVKLKEVKRMVIVACGTSWHAALVGKFFIEEYARIRVEVDIASEYRYRNPIVNKNDLLVVISQSGETADTLAALKQAASKGAQVVSICNVQGSAIARESDGVILTKAGPEIGVASTKAFTTQLTALFLLSVKLGRANNLLSEGEAEKIIVDFKEIPHCIDLILNNEDQIADIAKKYFKYKDFLFLGRGVNYPIALEGALKLKEISYIHAEGYPAGEMKHGPIALIDEKMPVVVIAPDDGIFEKVLNNIMEVKARGGKVIALVNHGGKRLEEHADDIIIIPKTLASLSPFLMVIPLQLIAYHIAVLRGCDVDQPRNLAKSVTVE